MSYSESNFVLDIDLGDMAQLRMNPVVRDMWVAELRSGNYLQGAGRLISVNALGTRFFCCLGVLCDIAVRAGIVHHDEVRHDFRTKAPVGPGGAERVVDRDSSALPEVVARWAGLWTNDPIVSLPNGERHHLSYLNDQRDDMTLPVIADLIQESL